LNGYKQLVKTVHYMVFELKTWIQAVRIKLSRNLNVQGKKEGSGLQRPINSFIHSPRPKVVLFGGPRLWR
jgi:hypothetical protein